MAARWLKDGCDGWELYAVGECVASHFPESSYGDGDRHKWFAGPYEGRAKTEAAARKACERALVRWGKKLTKLGGG